MVNTLPDVDLRHYIAIENNQLITQSTRIAEVFNKEHRNVLRSIRSLDCSDYFNALNFERVKYKDPKGEMREMYNVTKDGFMFLVMGFTGKQAAAIKEAYINAFNAMAEQIAAPNSHVDIPALQNTNQALQSELLTLYRDQVTVLKASLRRKARRATKRPANPPLSQIQQQAYIAEKQQGFIVAVRSVIQQHPSINKTNLLAKAGYTKDDKTARAWLAEFEGIHWHCQYVAGAYAYYLKGVSHE
jgi:Rha family phage regulatory protein